MRSIFDRRLKVTVTYEPVGVKYEHRYHIKCHDMNGGVTIYHSTNVIDKEVKYTQEEAEETVMNYFKITYGFDLPLNKDV